MVALGTSTSWAAATVGEAGAATPPPQPDVAAIAEQILRRTDLQEGERVLLVARPGRFDALVPRLRSGIRSAGGTDLGAILASGRASVGDPTEFTRSLVRLPRARLIERLTDVDLAIMLPDTTPADLVYAAMQDVLWQGRGRTIHFHWSGAYALSGNLREVDAEDDALYARVLRDTDYAALSAVQRSFEAAIRNAEITVTTPAGTNLRFPHRRSASNAPGRRRLCRPHGTGAQPHRPRDRAPGWRNPRRAARGHRAGHRRLPAIDVEQHHCRGLVLTFHDGVVVSASADSGLEAAEAVLQRGGISARSFREFALGFNPLLAIPEDAPWIPDYGYGAGVVRLSLGDNSELGGNVGGGFVRWNFFVDATVTVDGDIWVRNGRLVPR